MCLITWSDRLSVGVERIDDQHRQLIALINDLYNSMLCKQEPDIVQVVLQKLLNYVEFHFSTEHSLMVSSDYPDMLLHVREHFDLTQRLIKLNASDPSALAVMEFLRDWLNNHILGSDVKLGRFLTHYPEERQ